jgi:hypothetical protein
MAEHAEHTCSALSLRRGEPVMATASRVERWMLVEQPGAWGREALLESHLDPLVARALQSHGRRHGVRIVLIRRTGSHVTPTNEQPDVRRVYVANTTVEGGWVERLDVPVRELATIDLAAARETSAPGVGEPVPGALHVVCTHGRHDRCCADHGRPVARALAAAQVEGVWESSHVGGDRFAANVVSLPSGVYLGRVPPERAPAIVVDLESGLIDLEHYRGRCCYVPLVQAAELAVRRRLDERRLESIVLEESQFELDGEQVRTRFRHPQGVTEAVVRRRRGPVERLTCAPAEGRPWSYDLVELHTRS